MPSCCTPVAADAGRRDRACAARLDGRAACCAGPRRDPARASSSWATTGRRHAGRRRRPGARACARRLRHRATTVTNREFADFVRATRYVTDAERLGSSFVFYLQVAERPAQPARHIVARPALVAAGRRRLLAAPRRPGLARPRPPRPSGRACLLERRAGVLRMGRARLPSEAEWECAARGGLEGKRFAWGDELLAATACRAATSGAATSRTRPAAGWQPGPVAGRSGEPNGFGLFNVCGNVWEWCADWFARPITARRRRDPASSGRPASVDARRLVPVPRLLLQPLPRRRAQRQHAGQRRQQHRLSRRALTAAIRRAPWPPDRSPARRGCRSRRPRWVPSRRAAAWPHPPAGPDSPSTRPDRRAR